VADLVAEIEVEAATRRQQTGNLFRTAIRGRVGVSECLSG
jgi:hypothetical protein